MSTAMPLNPKGPIGPVTTPPDPADHPHRQCIEGRFPRDIIEAIRDSFASSEFDVALATAIVLVKGFDRTPDEATLLYQTWANYRFPTRTPEELLQFCQQADQLPDRVLRGFYYSTESGVVEAGTRAYGFDPSGIRPVNQAPHIPTSTELTSSATHAKPVSAMPVNAPASSPRQSPERGKPGTTKMNPSSTPLTVVSGDQPATIAIKPDQSALPIRQQRLSLLDLPPLDNSDMIGRLVLKEQYAYEDDQCKGCRLAYWGDNWYEWIGRRYKMLPKHDLRSRLTTIVADYRERDYQSRMLDHRMNSKKDAKAAAGPPIKTPRRAETGTKTITDILQSIGGDRSVHVPLADCDRLPMWRWVADERMPRDMMTFRNGMVDIKELLKGEARLYPHTARLFNTMELEYDYSVAKAICPRWMAFLEDVLSNEEDSIMALQEFMGYVLTADNHFQKMLVLIGAPSGGKGTILNVIHALVGKANYSGIKLRSLSGDFALAPLVGKAVAVDPDVRLDGKDRTAILDNLLSVTGNNPLGVNRKNKDVVEEHLFARFIIAMNEMPDFGDSSRALKRRMIMLRFRKSYENKPNNKLLEQLLEEKEGIVQWAIQGLKRLHANDGFTESASGKSLMEAIVGHSLADDFCEDHIDPDPEEMVVKDDVTSKFKDWCLLMGHDYPGPAYLWKKLHAKYSDLDESRPGPKGQQVRMVRGLRLRATHAKADPRTWLDGYLRGKGGARRDQVVEAAKAVGIDVFTLDQVARVLGVAGDVAGDYWSSSAYYSDNPAHDEQPADPAWILPGYHPDTCLDTPF